ncbi:uncharacterized protein RHO25_011998 [Cercospora beticola]|uniref:Rhodopsin domain-containing protein n=1 Tax=Cercospora beticola TaxID=122368 RepID=A0ABZ0P6N3_CERBT|nr:hypothetical protein RHO25_011998 [Cercospora beticola]
MILAATILACGEYTVTMYAARHGVGSSLGLLSESDQDAVNTAYRASQVIFLIALTLSKLSITLLILRIFSNLQSRLASMACTSVTVAVVAWGVASTLATSIRCEPARVQMEQGEQVCPGHEGRWLTITVAACLIETWIAALPAILCINLRMDLGKKIKVFLAFSFRLGCIVFAVMHYLAYNRAYKGKVEEAPLLADVVVWQQAGLCYSLLSATIPVSLNFIGQFTTGASVALSSGRKSSAWSSSGPFGNLSFSGKSKLSGSIVSGQRGTLPRQSNQVRQPPGVSHPAAAKQKYNASHSMGMFRDYAFQLPHVNVPGVIPDLPD